MQVPRNKLLLGDTLDLLRGLPSDSVDLALTSPPYNKQEKNRGWLVKEVRYQTHKDALPEQFYQDEQVNVLNELYRVMRPGGSFFYNHKLRWQRGEMLHPLGWILRTKWCVRQEIIWDRQIAGNIRGWRFWQVDERIYWLHKPWAGNKIGAELESRHALFTSIWRMRPEGKNPHPAPFPLPLPTRIIYAMKPHMPATPLVLDPYVGSGTSAVAAHHLKCDYLGLDNCQAYLAQAKKRLKNYAKEIQCMQNEIALHTVEKTFAQRKAQKKIKIAPKNTP